MEQPNNPNALPRNPSPRKDDNNTSAITDGKKNNYQRRPPSPEEVVAHYESQGLDTREAYLKAIGDLQTVLLRTVASGRGKKDKLMSDTGRKLDNVNTRLAILEMKLDSKPGFPESLAIGVSSGALLHAIGSALPHLGRIWNSVKTATKSSPPS